MIEYIWQHSRHKGSELLLLHAVARHADQEGKGWPGIPTLANAIRMSPRNTQRLLQRLEASGELLVQRGAGPHGANLLQINMTASLPLFGSTHDKLSDDKLSRDDKRRARPMTKHRSTHDKALSPERTNQKKNRPAKRGNGKHLDNFQPPAAADMEFPHGTTERQKAPLLGIGKKLGLDLVQLQLAFDEVRTRQERREHVGNVYALTDAIAQQIRDGKFHGERAAEQERRRGGGRPLSAAELKLVKKVA